MPAMDHRAPAHEAGPSGTSRPSSSQVGLRVLVVDDDDDAREILQIMLEGSGHPTDVAADGAEALALARGGGYAAAVIDLSLPGLDGCEVARAIRAHLGERTPRLVAMSGLARQDDRRRAAAAGFAAYLVKPARFEAVLASIAQPAEAGEEGAPGPSPEPAGPGSADEPEP